MSLPTITPADAKRLIDQGATLIDIRDLGERAREHIPGSHHGPLGALNTLEGVNAPIIFHCRAGKRTADNADQLRQAASCEAYALSGGIEAWKQAGRHVITDKNQPIDIGRQVLIAAGSLVLLGVLLGSLVRPELYALPGLVGAGLVFAGLSGWCGLAKLLGLMPWNQRRLGA